MLLGKRHCLPRLTPQGFELLLGVLQGFLGREHAIVGPLLELLARLVEVLAVLFEWDTDRGLCMTLGFGVGVETLG